MKRFVLVSLSALLLTSCATEKNVRLNDAFWQQKSHKIAVAAVKPAKPAVIMHGSQGLLDMAISSAMTNKLDHQMNTTDLSWYRSMPEQIAAQLNKRRIGAIVAGNDISDDDRRIKSLAAENNVNEVLVLRLIAVGAVRNYNGFVPTTAPEGYCVLKGELIDPATKQVKWRHLAEVKIPVQGTWDQPPTFPNVTVAVNRAISTAKQEIFDSLLSGH